MTSSNLHGVDLDLLILECVALLLPADVLFVHGVARRVRGGISDHDQGSRGPVSPGELGVGLAQNELIAFVEVAAARAAHVLNEVAELRKVGREVNLNKNVPNQKAKFSSITVYFIGIPAWSRMSSLDHSSLRVQ